MNAPPFFFVEILFLGLYSNLVSADEVMITTSANPQQIIADGVSTSQITAKIIDLEGKPVKNQKLKFVISDFVDCNGDGNPDSEEMLGEAGSCRVLDSGSLYNSNVYETKTNNLGIAKAIYTSPEWSNYLSEISGKIDVCVPQCGYGKLGFKSLFISYKKPIICGDADCDIGETCSNCELDCGCSSNEFCCKDKCVKVECKSNKDCNDGNELTTDMCMNLETCSPKCSNVQCVIKCNSHSDCSDGNFFTKDTCRNGGKCEASCNNEKNYTMIIAPIVLVVIVLGGILSIFLLKYKPHKKMRQAKKDVCPKCSSKLSEEDEFCPECGKKV